MTPGCDWHNQVSQPAHYASLGISKSKEPDLWGIDGLEPIQLNRATPLSSNWRNQGRVHTALLKLRDMAHHPRGTRHTAGELSPMPSLKYPIDLFVCKAWA